MNSHCFSRVPTSLPTQTRRSLLTQCTTALGALSVLESLVVTKPAHATVNLKLGQTAPNLTLHTLDGKDIRTQDLLGQVVILSFWATWCEPCHEELPVLSMFHEKHKDRGIHVLGFSLDTPEALSKVQRVASTLSFPVGLLGSAYAGDYGRIWNLPVNFVIDRAGRLAYNGWDDKQPAWTMPHLHSVIDPLV